MKRFLINAFVFALIFALANLTIKLTLNKLYFNDYNKVELDKEVYLLADSHGAVLGKFKNEQIYNFSDGSDSYYDIKRKLNFLIRRSNVNTIILTADDHTLSPYRNNINNKDRSVYFCSEDDYSSFFIYVWQNYINYNLVLLKPKYGALVKNFLKSKLFQSSKISNNKPWDLLTDSSKKSVASNRFEKQFSYGHKSDILSENLEDIINISRQNNIKIIGIKFPVSKIYSQIIGNHSYGADMLMKKKNIKILNFYNERTFQSDSFFKDQDHLNEVGSEKLKTYIKDSLSYILDKKDGALSP